MKDDENLHKLVLELITRFYDLQVLPEQLHPKVQRIAKIKIDVAQSMAEDDTMDITHATKMVDLMKQYPSLNRHIAKKMVEEEVENVPAEIQKMKAQWDKHNDWVYKNIVAPRLRKGINSLDMDDDEF